ncbi:MAG: chorismate-binding protein [Schwartzia sp.]|nr:chorismate-binding protein [Schwartzia sp. (in: firmicutes)]
MVQNRIGLTPALDAYRALAKETGLIPVSAEVSIDLDTPVSIYYKLVGDAKGFLLESVDTSSRTLARYSFIGAEPFIRLQVFRNRLMIKENDLMKCIDGEPVDALKQFMAARRFASLDEELPLANGGLVGYLNYEIVSTFDRVRGMEAGEEEMLGEFMVCRVIVAFDALKNTARLICLTDASEDAGAAYAEAERKMAALIAKMRGPLPSMHGDFPPRAEKADFLSKYAAPPEGVLDMIRTIKEHIFAGDIFQAVPSFRFQERITRPPFLFYRRLRQVNPSPYMFYLNFGRTKLVGASPERLVKVTGGKVYTYPIAGTRRRGADDEEDAALAAELLADEKECAEHAMLVDLARNDIGRISEPGSVRVTKLMAVERFSHVMHMVSEVVGTLRAGLSPADVLRASFPAGTVSGAPKLRAMEIVRSLEPVKRKSYAGAVGYMDFAGNMDVCITLRTMRIENDDTAFIQAGAGIVADSVPENEYNEFLQKAKALFKVVEEVENDAAPLG